MFLLHRFFLSLLIAATVVAETQPIEPVSQAGTIQFILHTDQAYHNGMGQANYTQELVRLPGINHISFQRNDRVINLRFLWDQDSGPVAGGGPVVNDILGDFTDFPGPARYHYLVTWDSARGISRAYLNGEPLRIPGLVRDPWWVPVEANEIRVGSGRLQVRDLEVTARYTPATEVRSLVPAELLGQASRLIGFPHPPKPIDLSDRRGALLYDNPLDHPQTVADWVVEGPAAFSFDNGYLQMRARNFEEHFVVWCPQDFPDSFVAEWDFKPLSDDGLAIIFFAAKGENGEDIFDPSLAPRSGPFRDYIVGDIVSYHISYYANVHQFQMGRVDSNLRKNNQFLRVGGGPVAIQPGAQGWQHMRLIKDGNRIQLFANGRIKVDWTDDNPERYGPPHTDGKIGFRQMSPTVAGYRNFRVWELE